MDTPVGRGITPGSDEERVPLSDANMQHLSRESSLLNIGLDRQEISPLISINEKKKIDTNPVSFDNFQLMPIYPEEKRVEGA